jgi:ADP-ribose pyrophosphatase YjhB (NUDIX family)
MTIDDPQWRPLRYCSRCGAALTRRYVHGRERPACPACGFVVYIDSKIACAAMVQLAGKLLLVRRRHEPGRGLWCLPCGFAEADEPPEQAARREAHEETGLDVTLEGLLGVYHYTDDPRGAGILLAFRASCPDPSAAAAGDDADALGFFGEDELPPISHHTHRRALEDWFGEQARRPAE